MTETVHPSWPSRYTRRVKGGRLITSRATQGGGEEELAISTPKGYANGGERERKPVFFQVYVMTVSGHIKRQDQGQKIT
ncbi:hypothetical protein NPIL_595691 [Nephila pilipes]|uniref:Uncharacterized protein n=1 Tax=Nephila pilipes TaxID=299642 RepID=A0A8X6Q5S5_NEPPI|nr:hypothetical protein NPIL_595691 [Nephila pilipes]